MTNSNHPTAQGEAEQPLANPDSSLCDYVVLGGGISGLSALHFLREKHPHASALLLEKESRTGGLMQTVNEDGWSVDVGPNGFLDREPMTLEIVRNVGAEPRMQRASDNAKSRFLCLRERLVKIPLSPPAFLFSGVLPLAGKLRLLCEPFVKPRRFEDDSGRIIEETIFDFAKRRIGIKAAENLVDPMVSGVFGGDSRRLSLRHCFPKMFAMEREYGSLFKALRAKKKQNPSASAAGPAGVLTSFAEGAGELPRAITERYSKFIRTGFGAERIERAGDGWSVISVAGGVVRAKKIVVATPAYAAGKLIANVDDDAANFICEVPYASMTVICTGYKNEDERAPVDGFGFLTPRKEKRRVLGALFSSSIFEGRAPEGCFQLRTMIGGASDPDGIELTDDALLRIVHNEVETMLGISREPRMVRIFRHRWAIPQYETTHERILEALRKFETANPTIAFAGNAYFGVGLNDCVLNAKRAVEKLR
ncbi:MAG: protoporphyrinogen oxidase [Planctomycetes bacterium]|nr:protoporphyrinogen oxidase [Planctomycetota bacterium]